MGRRWKVGFGALGTAVAAVGLTLGVLEVGLRAYFAAGEEVETGPPLHVPCGECPELYRLNSEHPEINAQGLRDELVVAGKPEGLFRILVLGDSVTYGPIVNAEERFTELLESRLRRDLRVEVINAGVSGYTTFNEQRSYPALAREFRPDLTLIAFVLNDVANPRLHWGYTRETLRRIPPEAIPNPAYDRQRNRFWRRSVLYRFLHLRFLRAGLAQRGFDGDGWPIHLTGEDPLPIQVLLDEDSPEWSWLRGLFGKLQTAVERDGGRLAVLFLPLSYQLRPGYPYVPQELFANFCRRQGLSCLDLLPAMRGRKEDELFLGQRSGYQDIWHLSEEGHRVVAAATERFLWDEGLLRSVRPMGETETETETRTLDSEVALDEGH